MKAWKSFGVALVLLLMFFTDSQAQTTITWKATNQATIAWDAVTAFTDNKPFPTGTTVKYAVYTRKDVDPPTAPPAAQVTLSDIPTAVVTLTTEGKYFVGVQSQRYDNAVHNVAGDSTISWSDVAANTQGNLPFGLAFFEILKQPGGMR